MDPRVSFVCVIRSRLVFGELRKWIWYILIVVAHDITKSSCEMTGGTWRTRGPRFTRRTLWSCFSYTSPHTRRSNGSKWPRVSFFA